MRSRFRLSTRRALAALLAVLLFLSPAAALRLFLTIRFELHLGGEAAQIRGKLKMNRKTPPLEIEVHRPLVIRKSETARAGSTFERAGLDERADVTAVAPVRAAPVRGAPAYLRLFLPSTPQNPVYPPDPDPLS